MRWRQYRSVWAWVEGGGCRRTGILRHFGDRSEPAPAGACCDVCDPGLVPALPPTALRQSALAPVGGLDGAILDIVTRAMPGVGRTRAVEILRGGRSKAIDEALLRRAAELRRLPRPARRGGAGRDRRPGRRRHAALTDERFPKLEHVMLEAA